MNLKARINKEKEYLREEFLSKDFELSKHPHYDEIVSSIETEKNRKLKLAAKKRDLNIEAIGLESIYHHEQLEKQFTVFYF